MKIIKFEVYRNKEFEDEKALVDVTDGQFKVVLNGDIYHNKIDERIEGFLDGLTYTEDVKYELRELKKMHITHKDEKFVLIGFTQEDFEDEE